MKREEPEVEVIQEVEVIGYYDHDDGLKLKPGPPPHPAYMVLEEVTQTTRPRRDDDTEEGPR